MKNFIINLFVIILTLFGCESEVIQSQDVHKNLLQKLYSSSDNYTEYFYDSSNKIIKVKSYFKVPTGEEFERETKYEYDKNESNIKKETTFSTYIGVPQYSYLSYEYNEQNLISKTKAYLRMSDGNYDLRSTTIYDYDNSNRLSNTKVYSPESIERKRKELFYDSNGNVIETNFYQDGNLSFNDKYEYDNMINPLRQNVAGTSIYTISKNNPIKHISTNFMLGNDTSVTEFNYEYNSEGYPLSYSQDSQKFYFEYYQ
jgi:hypothetical protein